MKIVVTGATGSVGRSLVPLLAETDAELLLVGRDPEKVARMFPGLQACNYADIAHRAAGFDLLVHLAVVNNNANVTPEKVHDVNVRQLLYTVSSARKAGIGRFVNVSSVHALDPGNFSAYAQSKRAAVEKLAEIDGIGIVTVYLPAVHGDRWSGKLSVLNTLPAFMGRASFQVLAALRPTVHISRLSQFLMLRCPIEQESEVVLSDGQERNFFYRVVSRSIDLVFAFSVAILLGWALALIWAMVRLQSPGPGIFAQKRVGRNGEIFTCYKFRTMKLGTREAATNQVSKGAVTRLGRFLRKTKLDELPQIWNIFRNEMSLLGPRPCLPVQKEMIEARRRRGVLRLKPGISGLAQINGIDMSDPEMLARWDARYAALQSLLLDLRIILATATGSGQGDRVAGDR